MYNLIAKTIQRLMNDESLSQRIPLMRYVIFLGCNFTDIMEFHPDEINDEDTEQG